MRGPFTLRLPQGEYDALKAVGTITGTSMADLVRIAITDDLAEFVQSGRADQCVEAARLRAEAAHDVLQAWAR